MARAVERSAGMVDMDAFGRGGEAVGIAFAPDLAVGDDVEAGPLLRPDGEQRGVVLRLGEIGLRNAPQLFSTHARRKAPGKLFPVDQPFGLGITSHQRRWKQHLILSYELRRYLAQPLAVDASASLNVAPGKIPRREPHVLGKALVPVRARIGGRDQLFHDRAARRFEAFQRFVNISFNSQGLRERDSVLHSEARARADREMRRAQRVAYQYHVSRRPPGVAQVREVSPYGLVRHETVPSQCLPKHVFTIVQCLSFIHAGKAGALPSRGIAFDNESTHRRRVAVVMRVEAAILVLDKGLRQGLEALGSAEPAELVGEIPYSGAERVAVRTPHERIDPVA